MINLRSQKLIVKPRGGEFDGKKQFWTKNN